MSRYHAIAALVLALSASLPVSARPAERGHHAARPSAPSAPPDADDIRSVLTASSIKYVGGQYSMFLQAYPSPFGGIGFYVIRDVSNVSCQPAGHAAYRCSYHLNKKYAADKDSLWGSLATAMMPPESGDWTNSFSRANGEWHSLEVDQENYQSAQASRRAASDRNADDARAEQDDDEQYNSCMSQKSGFGGNPYLVCQHWH